MFQNVHKGVKMLESILTEKELCKYLKISRTTLWRLKKNGMPSLKIRNSFRYNIDEVTEWMVSESTATYLEKTGTKDELFTTEEFIPKDRIFNYYKINLKYLFDTNLPYLKNIFDKDNLEKLRENILKYRDENLDNQEIVQIFSREYLSIIKDIFRKKTRTIDYDQKIDDFVNKDNERIKIIWGNCLDVLRKMETESIQLMVTSPPYYNARDYSNWKNLKLYLNDMEEIIKESYRVLDNHRLWVFNVGDIFDNDNLVTGSVWGKRRIPLGTYFINIFEDAGFEFVDDIIWDKGEVESKRHMNNGINYPLYQYPLNCYEHILIFHKHRLDKTKIPCPICGSLKVSGNTQSEIGIQSWECKNDKCFVRSPHNRGKRFSLRTNTMQYYHNNDFRNLIEKEVLKKWRRDIVKFPPVIKITHKRENKLGHSAPFPEDIPEMAVRYFTYINEKVLDPFAGSFTTPIVAKSLGRSGIGIELNKELFRDSIIKRIRNRFSLFNYKDEICSEYTL